MLMNLSINNVAVIEKAEVEFSEGFNVLTGETGAGKSILMDALSMVLGMRTSRDLIRTGADEANVSALFFTDCDLSDLDIESEEDNSLHLSRKLSRDGKSICRINSRTVPLSTLRAVGERLLNIHGQNDNIALLKSSYHLSLLDEYAQNTSLFEEYSVAYTDFIKAREKLEEMKLSESDREIKKDMLNFRIEEIKSVSPQKGEDDLLSEKRDALKNFSQIAEAMETSYDAIKGRNDALGSLFTAMQNLEKAASMDKSLTELSNIVTDLYYNAEDAAMQISSYTSKMSFSPEELNDIEDRLDKITRLKKKYGGDLDTVLSNLNIWESEYGELLFYDDSITLYEEELKKAEAKMLSLGKNLQATRLEASKKLSTSIEEELSFLDMPKVTFSVKFTPHTPSNTGLFSAEFMLSTNPSEAPKPLNRIASGGEMSRIMLALKTVLADCDNVGTLIFDEIDTGVSGRAAGKIAQKLKALSKNRQIICITHLPQMASSAHNHLLISKDTSAESFTTHVQTLDFEGRVQELSRLISSDTITESALLAAREMLKEAE